MSPNSPYTANHPDKHLQPPIPFYRKPLFVGSMVITVLLGFSFWSYSQNPQWLEYSQGESVIDRLLAANPDLTREELAAMADVDNVSLLMEQLNLPTVPTPELPIAETDLPSDNPSQSPTSATNELTTGLTTGTDNPLLPGLIPNDTGQFASVADLLKQTTNGQDSPSPGSSQQTNAWIKLTQLPSVKPVGTVSQPTVMSPLQQALSLINQPSGEANEADSEQDSSRNPQGSNTATTSPNPNPSTLGNTGSNGTGMNAQIPATGMNTPATGQPYNPYNPATSQGLGQQPNYGNSYSTTPYGNINNPPPNVRGQTGQTPTMPYYVPPTRSSRNVSPNFNNYGVPNMPQGNNATGVNPLFNNPNMTQQQPNRGQNNSFNPSGPQMGQQSTPIRRIGNGEINTFANP
ncbi:hypothetical protein K4A83_16430 [Spirulina subsalsa FACHB-351]|uniref:Uncharacterized protein n=1 Tax=Spirulina subsalsa FACHB-351 TaxID=234711 RepID=A0ABT3L8R6_9CYAN|nr:hypothetical protein [Spirulina subsalsa]MCW6037847.1 hypothetical protein [Spirulina subsalsa FACHB-351]